jgi:PKD repeat protein
MDYDVVTGGITYNPTNADVTLPNSLYLASKPTWFGSLAWPPFNPTNPPSSMLSANTMAYTNIPAGYRYQFGSDPLAGPVNQPPVAVASGAPTNGPAPLAVSFSSAGSYDPEGAALSYAWTFGDGTTSTAANPSHTYQNPGSYSAQLSVSDGTSTTTSTSITINLTIAGTNQPPVAVASATPTAGPAPLSVSFSSAGSYDPEGATLSYNWTFGDGSTSTAANPSHTYAAGTFSAQLSVSDGTNSTSSSPMTISVTNPAPTVLLNSPANGASYAAPAIISLAASVTPNGHTITKQRHSSFGRGHCRALYSEPDQCGARDL